MYKITRRIFIILLLSNLCINASYGSQRTDVALSKIKLLAFKNEAYAMKEVLLSGRSNNEVSVNAQKLKAKIDEALKITEHNFVLMVLGNSDKIGDIRDMSLILQGLNFQRAYISNVDYYLLTNDKIFIELMGDTQKNINKIVEKLN